MASLDESYRARWFLSCKSCHPALAAPVGQSTLDGANGFHRRVRHCHFRECPLKKHLNNCGARLRRAQSAQSPSFAGPNPPRCLGFAGPNQPRPSTPKHPGHFSTRATIRCGASAPKRQGNFSARHQSASPFQLLEPKARKPKTISPNHQGKAQSSLAFSRRRFGGWQPRFRLRRIRQLPLHQAPGAYRPAPTQEPSRE